MKKQHLITGILEILIAVGCILGMIFLDSRLVSLFSSCAAAFLVIGIRTVRDYRYWSAEENRERYREIQDAEAIEANDEMKEKVRGKAAQYTCIFSLYTLAGSVILFSVLDALEIMNARPLILYMGAFMLVQYIAGRLFYKHLMKKYETP